MYINLCAESIEEESTGNTELFLFGEGLILGKEDSSKQAESERLSECDDSDLTLGHRKHISLSCSLDHLALNE